MYIDLMQQLDYDEYDDSGRQQQDSDERRQFEEEQQ
jgi:hypothetical protein